MFKARCDVTPSDTLAVAEGFDCDSELLFKIESNSSSRQAYLSFDSVKALHVHLGRLIQELAPPVEDPGHPEAPVGVAMETGLGRIKPHVDRVKQIDAAVAALHSMFGWYDSPEGHDFWQSISDRLRGMAAEMRSQLSAKTVILKTADSPEGLRIVVTIQQARDAIVALKRIVGDEK